MFILQNASARAPRLPGLSAHFLDIDPEIARFDLTLELAEVGKHLTGFFEYSTDLFETSTIARMATHLRILLEAIVANPGERVSRFPLLSASERSRVLTDWNGTLTNFSRLGNFSEWFSRRLERAPDATAVSAGQVRFSYRELARRGSAIAHQLVLEGIGPDVVVALLAERNADLVAAIIAIKRVGGAFLCLEPTLPAARLAQFVRSSGARVLLAGQSSAEVLGRVLSRMPALRILSRSCLRIPGDRSDPHLQIWHTSSTPPDPREFRKAL
jgi:non-ribosomal peptide synthetase component F